MIELRATEIHPEAALHSDALDPVTVAKNFDPRKRPACASQDVISTRAIRRDNIESRNSADGSRLFAAYYGGGIPTGGYYGRIILPVL